MRNRPYTPSYFRIQQQIQISEQQQQISEEGNDDSITPETAYVNLNQRALLPQKKSDIGKG